MYNMMCWHCCGIIRYSEIASVQGDSGTDGRGSDVMDGGRMALDNKTSLLNTPLLSSSPRGTREHFLDSPFKHSRKDTSMDDSEHFTDGTLMEGPKHKLLLLKRGKVVIEVLFLFQQTAVWTSQSWWPSCSKSCPITTNALRRGRRLCVSCSSWFVKTPCKCGMNTSRPSCFFCSKRWVTER